MTELDRINNKLTKAGLCTLAEADLADDWIGWLPSADYDKLMETVGLHRGRGLYGEKCSCWSSVTPMQTVFRGPKGILGNEVYCLSCADSQLRSRIHR